MFHHWGRVWGGGMGCWLTAAADWCWFMTGTGNLCLSSMMLLSISFWVPLKSSIRSTTKDSSYFSFGFGTWSFSRGYMGVLVSLQDTLDVILSFRGLCCRKIPCLSGGITSEGPSLLSLSRRTRPFGLGFSLCFSFLLVPFK